jgi:glycosyltransferase involved in cell wall biosynthesis
MHVLFVHQNFPAQFGHVASHLVRRLGFECTFVSQRPPGDEGGIRRLQYSVKGGATRQTHYCSRSFENYVWHSHAVYEAMKAHPEIRPDLVVGHSGFGSTVFLPDLYDAPVINYFEYYYRSRDSDMDFRKDFPTSELDRLRVRTRNSMLLTDLATCDAGYSPTQWQRSLFPAEYRDKIEVVFDGVDLSVWRRSDQPRAPIQIGGRRIGSDVRLVTYVARGFESMRGFDVFMKVAKRLCEARSDVVVVCAGSDRVCYGGDSKHIQAKTFRQHVLESDSYDLERILFPGLLPPRDLAALLSRSDLHVYLTVPFVLSWSAMNALACGCVVLASDTPPVVEMIQHGQNGLLADFHDVEGLTRQALDVLDRPSEFRPLGDRAAEIIREKYSLDAVLPRIVAFYRRVVDAGRCPVRPTKEQ